MLLGDDRVGRGGGLRRLPELCVRTWPASPEDGGRNSRAEKQSVPRLVRGVSVEKVRLRLLAARGSGARLYHESLGASWVVTGAARTGR